MGERVPDEYRSPIEREDLRKTIYCGGLRYETDEQTIKSFFEDEYGPVTSVKIITDRETGNSRGFCFVNFGDERDAQDALQSGTGKVLDGAPIRINVSRAQLRGPGFDRGRGRGRMGGFPGRPYYRDGPGPGPGMYRGRDHMDNDRYSPPARGRSHSPPLRRRSRSPPQEGADGDRKRRRYFTSRSRSPGQQRSRSISPAPAPARAHSRSRSPRPSSVAAAPRDQREHASHRAPPAAGHHSGGGSGELGQLRQSEAEAAARVRKVEGELERQRIMSHELESELSEMHAEARQREAQLRRHRELLSQLHSGVGRLVAARRELRTAEDSLTALYAESASFMERGGAAAADGSRRRGGEPTPQGPGLLANGGARREAPGTQDADAQLQRAMQTAVHDDVEVPFEGGGWREAGGDGDAPVRFRLS